MTRFADIATPTPINMISAIAQSADPVDLQRRVNAALAKLATDLPGSILATLTLAGAGDGHTFLVKIEATTSGPPIGIVIPTVAARVFCYQAADALELQKAQAFAQAAALAAGLLFINDEQISGASQGTRFMGMIVGTAP
jgi:hypothetical protein